MAENWFGLYDLINESWVGGPHTDLQSAMDAVDALDFGYNCEIRSIDPTMAKEIYE